MTATGPQPAQPKPRRRWFQYSLRTLFLLTLLASIGLSWFTVRMQRARRQKEAVEEIQRLDGAVQYDYEVQQSGNRLPGAVPPGPAWLRSLLGDDVFAAVVYVYFPSSVTDAGLEHLKGLTQLQTLDLIDTQVTDGGLKHLKGLMQLRRLLLKGTRVTKEGVKTLQQALPNCRIYR
jgi:hypothetical protein